MKEQQEALHRAPATDTTLDADAARALIFPLYEGRLLRTGEPFADHAEGVAQIVRSIRAAPDLLAAAYLFGAHEVLRDAEEWVRSRAGAAVAAPVQQLERMLTQCAMTRQSPT